MRIFDLSQPLFDGCPNCPVHPPVRLPRVADHPGDGWRMEEFHMASHTGTHLDAPLHKLALGGAIDAFPLEAFVGQAHVIELKNADSDYAIKGADFAPLYNIDLHGAIVLLNTGWGHKRAATEEYLYHSPYLSAEGAQWLVDRGVKGVGIDHFSIGGMSEENTQTHEILLGAALWVVEDLVFREGWRSAASAQGALFQALPLLLPGFSGSPCRAVFVY
ncbi:MAG: cyclase family protein [Candidatus Methylacidiphilales bacterium]|nr:cyclase family protein [Candidatus Methylacidiphilales bacterium]